MVKKEWRRDFKVIPGVADRAQPFEIITGDKHETLVVMVHGFTGSPYIMKHLAEFLAEAGLDVKAILLAGHGRSPQALGKTNHQDWYQSVDEVVTANIDKYENIFLVGHSFGANMSIHAAIKYPKIKGIISLGVSISIIDEIWIRLLLPLARIFKKQYKKRWIKKETAERLHATGRYTHIPIRNIVQFYSFIDNFTKKEIPKLKCPILVMHSREDEVSHPRGSEFLFKRLTMEDKELFILDKNNHGLLHKTRRDFVFNKIVRFIEKRS
ncbi:alpha/beta fold hydrolase [Candidatus Parcubacteria bacterium]|jgi:carboxylesterase|nr:alpha/beta fold hydrolase [Candidatus Parcubacteria bacterium]